MKPPRLDPPLFGDPLGVVASPETLRFLARRRSASALGLTAPAPSGSELETLLRIAARAPDHGKLAPWRFVTLAGEDKSSFVSRLDQIAARRPDADTARTRLAKLAAPPLSVVVISSPKPGKIPDWEQTLSAGAVCFGLILAAQAMGYGANWITDWYAYDPQVLSLLGLDSGERVCGFVHIGTAAEAPLERARPDMGAIVTQWRP